MVGVNIKDSTKSAVQELIKQSYINSARIDRMKSVLVADLSYNNTCDVVHEFIAHYFSNGLGDFCSERLLERFNISVIYGGIPIMDKKYNDVEEILSELLNIVIDFQNKISKCIQIAYDNDDRHISSELVNVEVDFNQVVDQCIMLLDKIKMYKDNPSFDAHIKEHMLVVNGKLKLLDKFKMKVSDL